ncbi:MAG: Ca2+-binding EF-hand superfamily protein [Planctomycetota bacterium]|jgi:Ca2+-binding EF-hand superfamily protein
MKITTLVIAGLVLLACGLSAQEDPTGRSERRARAMKKFDKNGDGKLDQAERAAARAERRQGKEANNEASPRRRNAAGKRGQERRAAMLKQFDTNQDGQVDENERKSMRADRLKKRSANSEISNRRTGMRRHMKRRFHRRRRMAHRRQQFMKDEQGNVQEKSRLGRRSEFMKRRAERQSEGQEQRPKSRRGRSGERRAAILERADLNGDGQIDKAEMKAARDTSNEDRRSAKDPKQRNR